MLQEDEGEEELPMSRRNFLQNSDLRLHGATGEPSDKKQEVETHFTGEAA